MRPTPARLALPLLLVLLAAALPGQLAAQPARVVITVTDTSGEPVRDARITATTAQRDDIEVKIETNARGKASLLVPNVTFTYDVLIEAEGHQSITATVKPRLGETLFQEFELAAAEEAAPEAATPDAQAALTPAQQAFNAGVEALGEGDHAAALERFLDARAKDPELNVVNSGLAAVYLEQDRAAEALEAAQRFLEAEPKSPRGLRLLYQAHQRLGNDEEAKEALEELASLEKGADVAVLLYNEGAEAVKVGDLDSAERRFLEALESQPDLVPAMEALMIVHARRADWQRALERAEQVLAQDAQNARALGVRYDAYRALGDAVKEKEALQALAAVNPAALVAGFMESGVAKFNAGDAKGAIADLEKVVELQPENANAHYYLGLCYTNAGQPEQAKTHLQRFVELAPDDPNAASAREMLQYLK